MTQQKRTTMAITGERKEKLEQIAMQKTIAARKVILWTDLVNELIDDLINKETGLIGSTEKNEL